MSLRNFKNGFELDDDVLGTAAGGAFSDIRTNVQIVVEELKATGSISQAMPSQPTTACARTSASCGCGATIWRGVR